MHRSYIQTLTIVLSLFLSSNSLAQTQKDSSAVVYKNIMSNNPIFCGVGMYNLSYERALSKIFALNIYAQYEFRNKEPALYSKTGIFFTQVRARFYPFTPASRGFFCGGYLAYGNGAFETRPFTYFDDGGGSGIVSDPSYSGDVNSFSFGPEIGYRFLIIQRLSVEFDFGCGPNFYSAELPVFDLIPLTNDFMVIPGINIGYAFN
jgi:hypothetical protein